MQNTKTTETGSLVVFETEVTTKAGGICLATTDLVETSVVAGTPVGADTNGLFHVVKTALVHEAANNSATDYKVKKGHNFKVADVITTGLLAKAYPITAITTTETDYDTITVGTTLGAAVTTSSVLIQATAQATGSTSAWKYTPVGLLFRDMTVDTSVNTNDLNACVIACAAVREANCPPIGTDVKTALKLIQFT